MAIPSVRIVYSPVIKPFEGTIPYIDMKNPLHPDQNLIPEIIFGDEEIPHEKGRYFFDLPVIAAQKVLANDDEIYQLWEPNVLRVPKQNGFGTIEMVEYRSVKALAEQGATNLRDPKFVPAKPAESVKPPVGSTESVPTDSKEAEGSSDEQLQDPDAGNAASGSQDDDDPVARAARAALAAQGQA